MRDATCATDLWTFAPVGECDHDWPMWPDPSISFLTSAQVGVAVKRQLEQLIYGDLALPWAGLLCLPDFPSRTLDMCWRVMICNKRRRMLYKGHTKMIHCRDLLVNIDQQSFLAHQFWPILTTRRWQKQAKPASSDTPQNKATRVCYSVHWTPISSEPLSTEHEPLSSIYHEYSWIMSYSCHVNQIVCKV